MLRLTRGLVVIAVLAVALLPAMAAGDSEPEQGREANVLVTVEIGSLEGESQKKTPIKSYSLIVASGGDVSKLLAGTRFPFPAADGEDGVVYQNIGFVTHARAWILDDKRVRLMADIEDSRVEDSEDPEEAPRVETWQLSVSAILKTGEHLDLTRVERLVSEDRAGYVSVVVEVLP